MSGAGLCGACRPAKGKPRQVHPADAEAADESRVPSATAREATKATSPGGSGAHAGNPMKSAARATAHADSASALLREREQAAKVPAYGAERGRQLCCCLMVLIFFAMPLAWMVLGDGGTSTTSVAPRVAHMTSVDLATVVESVASGESSQVFAETSGSFHDFSADLDRSSGEALGMDLTSEYNSLYVRRIPGGGLVERWNKAHPNSTLSVGDRIVSVNGHSGTSQELLGACDAKAPLKLKMVRVSSGPLQKPRPYETYNIVLDHSGGEDFGADFRRGNRSLLIMEIGDGLLQEWNGENSRAAVHPGDRVLSVNGKSGTGDELSSALSKEAVLEIELLKGEAAYVEESAAPVTAQPTTAAPNDGDATRTSDAPLTTTTRPQKPEDGSYVRGLLAEFWVNIDRDIPERPFSITIDRLHSLMQRPPDLVRVDKQVFYPVSSLGWEGVPKTDYIAARWTGQLQIFKAGRYSFMFLSDDGAALILDGKPLAGEHPYYDQHEWSAEPRKERDLAKGMHDVRIEYFNTFHLSGVILKYAGPDTGDSMITVPNVVLRTSTDDLPPTLLNDTSVVRRYDNAGLRLAPGSVLRLADGIGVAVFASLLVRGAIALGVKWRRRRRAAARYLTLQSVMS
mmetsp:Transcript_50417/g.145305  ORF Transcript_50417/g.145305 Transcript_50417/m.145305 type:complete len:627 (-) Transcript_50417:69-1949(-)